ncbi:MAG: allantoinase AllB [Firmicutes bacterium]|nr:allantoinase AllB [Bacillota bacterium]
MVDLTIKGAKVVTEEGVFQGGVAVKEGQIVALGKDDTLPTGQTCLDAKGQYLLPGGVDPHVHIRYPGGAHRETFETGSAAAAAGGITTIIEHPISSPPQYSVEILMTRVKAAREQSIVDFAFLGAAGGEKLSYICDLGSAGIVGYKTFLHGAPEGRDKEFIGLTMKNNYQVYCGFSEVSKTNLPIGAHAEDDDLIAGLINQFRAAGKTGGLDHARSRPPITEVMTVERLIRIARETGVTLYLVHISTPEAVAVAKQARESGQKLYIETCPHYLYLTENDLVKHGPYAKCNPPLRSADDVEGLWKYVIDGTIDTIGSDHGPFTTEEKNQGVDDIFVAPAGFPGLETRLPLMLTAVKEGRLSLQRTVELLSTNPSKAFGLYPRKGTIRIGSDADFALIDMDTPFVINHEEMVTKSRDACVVYDGRSVFGRVTKTIVRGRVVYDNGKITMAPGYGQWILPQLLD